MNRDEEIRIMSLPKMQEKFREAMGLIQLGDLCLYQDDVFIVTDKDDYYKTVCLIRLKVSEDEANEFWPTEKSVIHLPLPIDPVNPERGLLGMAGPCNIEYCGDYVYIHGATDEEAETVELALLKYLAHQWNVEVEG